MAITWETMKLYILEGLLKDAEGDRYTDPQLYAYARWACSELAHHTAIADLYTFTCDGTQKTFPLPTNMIETIEKCGLVAYDDGKAIEYLSNYRLMPEVLWPTDLSQEKRVFWEWPTNHLTLGFTPIANSKIILYYFRSYNVPSNLEDVLEIPQWMEQPFAFLIAAGAMEPIGAQAANIRQWNRKQDSGNPEHNPAQKQAAWFIQQAYRLLSRVTPQDRETFYRLDPRTPTR